MDRYIFFSDLDRTLIFSYNRLTPEDERICVEKKGKKELSFMTPQSAETFAEIDSLCRFIPVTSRSEEQYKRIFLPFGIKPHLAIIDNGANLLIDGEPDAGWNRTFSEAFRKAADEIRVCKEYLQKCENTYFEIRIVDDSFLFTKCKDSDAVAEDMRKTLGLTNSGVFTNGDKLYVIPDGITKEAAQKELRKRFPDHIVIAAGDSPFDENMLRDADISVINKGELTGMQLCPKQLTFSENDDDTSFVTQTVKKILTGEIDI
ncbi:MAG: HAD hydrolase family protein [Oscillospiraceae bacterium]|nr:HAD hydrolase family protein [Oscillospiraceae bacterium]